MSAKNFNGVARFYRALEYIAFGGDLERARFAHIERLAGCKEVLILGDGDGRFAQRLASLAPRIRIHCIDHSAGMIAMAKERMATVPNPERVRFTEADATAYRFESGRYDAVTTLFFLDCFRDDQVQALVGAVSRALAPEALWLFADFQIAASGYPRLRSRIWLSLLYFFFRLTTGIEARALPQTEAIIVEHGFTKAACIDLQAGLLRSALFERRSIPVTEAAAAGPSPAQRAN